MHAIVNDGRFLGDGSFIGAPGFHGEDLEGAFQYEVLKMLTKEGKINDAIIENMLSWRHTGFYVHIGARIWPEDETALATWANILFATVFQRNAWFIFRRKNQRTVLPGSSTHPKMTVPKKHLTYLTDLPALLLMFPTNTSNWSDTSGIIPTNPWVCARRLIMTMSSYR